MTDLGRAAQATAEHMVQLHFDAARLWGRSRALGLDRTPELDVGYLIHTQLAGLFGDKAPGPFSIEERRGSIRVLAYGAHSLEDLREQASAVADPAVWAAVRWEECASKPMPRNWAEGSRFAFELRVCPVVRRTGDDGRRVERDAYLASLDRDDAAESERDRYGVYIDWVRARLERDAACKLLAAEVSSFRLTRFVRSLHDGGSRRTLRRPDASVRGRLAVGDADAFARLIARGVGRHRAFGFGMLLLRPDRAGC